MKIRNTKRNGSVMDVLSVGICILAMSIIMMAYLNSLNLVSTKAEISQLARKYILRMESVGCLTSEDKAELVVELESLGCINIDLSGSTLNKVDYGSPILLCIQGIICSDETSVENGLFGTVFIEKEYHFKDVKMSTAKN